MLFVAISVLMAAGCTGGKPIPSAQPHPGTPTASGRDVAFHAFGSPPPPGKRCPTPSRLEGAYQVLIAPTAGKPGTRVTMGGNTPLFDKAGRYLGPSGKIGFWFNLPFGNWANVYFGHRPPDANDGIPVIHLGEANVAGECSYRVSFKVPEVPSGTYEILPISHTRNGSAAFEPIQFRVTG
jgi:hypothetical protein